MRLFFFPRRTPADVQTNAVRSQRPAPDLRLIGRVRLQAGGEAIVIGRRTTRFGQVQVLVQGLLSGAQGWVPSECVTPIGKPKLELIQGGLA